MISWNPWHGCKHYSEGCLNCYVDRLDKFYNQDSKWHLNQAFELPLQKNRQGLYKYPSGTKFFTCFTSDFFIEDADQVRPRIWEIIKERSDCFFMIITKRIDMIYNRLPPDWGYGYSNVEIVCTIENQLQADYRLPIYKELPIIHKSLCIEPLISQVSIELYLPGLHLEKIICGGESGYGDTIRPCKEEWVYRLYTISHKWNIPFCFKQTGTKFIRLNNTLEIVPRNKQMEYAKQLPYQDFLIESL